MRKIPTLYRRDPSDMKRLIDEVHPDCGWVLRGEGVAMRKVDGTSCRYAGGRWWKRREVRPGSADPAGFELEQEDPATGKRFGWLPVESGDRWHAEAIVRLGGEPREGTYELIGP